ncbi:MAG: putative ATPase, partial [Chthonomonadales bacterium]|nr:putative ATPase [Chthonomonadales bacterium]
MNARCRIELLGDLRVVLGEQVHTRFRTRKAAHLLAYLALHPQQAQPRERLVELFWGDREEAVGRDGLSTALAQLRRQLEGEGLPVGSLFLADKQQVRLNPLAVSTDVAEFDLLLDRARQSADKPERADLLQEAVGLYRGDLLPDCYDAWASVEQTRCRVLFQESLMRLTPLWEEAGRFAEALTMAQRACAADPFAEEGYRAQMRLLVRLKKPSMALQLYESLEQLFRKELGARPSASTRQMAEMIRQDPQTALLIRAESAPPAAASVPSPEVAECDNPPPPTATPVNAPILPLQLTRFFGREQEREQIADLLQTPGTRLVSLLGPGGTGKTRLSLEVATQVTPAFVNRVWFVALADIPDAGLIVSTLVHALRLPPDAQADPLERVVAHLGHAPCLLVLDNLEHLLCPSPPPHQMGKNDNPAMSGTVGLIRVLLQRVPALVCLVTSRQALQLGGEQVFPVPPLTLPADATPLETLRSNDSIALYMDRARSARPDFALTTHNAIAITTLCRRLEGMPLALEMAAAWVKTIPPHKMLERLEHQLDLLVSRRRDLPARHQSLRATIEWSYDLLPADLRRLFARLSVFRGGWTLEAAETVCGDEALHGLIALQEHSLVIAIEEADAPRYRMLEPLREFAAEKLVEMGDAGQIQDAHAAYYTEIARQADQHYGDSQLKNWLDQLDANWDNLRTTFAWCREHERERGLRMVGCL